MCLLDSLRLTQSKKDVKSENRERYEMNIEVHVTEILYEVKMCGAG
jgi:hypothetical protein